MFTKNKKNIKFFKINLHFVMHKCYNIITTRETSNINPKRQKQRGKKSK